MLCQAKLKKGRKKKGRIGNYDKNGGQIKVNPPQSDRAQKISNVGSLYMKM